jgi:hypothetical protein
MGVQQLQSSLARQPNKIERLLQSASLFSGTKASPLQCPKDFFGHRESLNKALVGDELLELFRGLLALR